MKKLLPAVFLLAAVFTACEKIDYNDLEGSVWEAKTDEAVFTLRFVDGTLCTLETGRNDGTYSANLTAYSWRYRSDEDSMWGAFFLRTAHSSSSGGWEYAGSVENRTLYLHSYGCDFEILSFKRK